MRRFGLVLLLLLLVVVGDLFAIELEGIKLEPSTQMQGETLRFNGAGVRKKFFMSIYVGSLYTSAPVQTTAQALTSPGGKLIRMNFLYDKLDRLKITGSFAEGLKRNYKSISGTPEEAAFIGWFKDDFVKGDVVDLELGADGIVLARHNGLELGRLRSAELAKGILLIYLGEKPADEDLKTGMLSGTAR